MTILNVTVVLCTIGNVRPHVCLWDILRRRLGIVLPRKACPLEPNTHIAAVMSTNLSRQMCSSGIYLGKVD